MFLIEGIVNNLFTARDGNVTKTIKGSTMNKQATPTLTGECLAEFIGTGLLIFFGVGCVAALILAGANFGQWEISLTWGFGVSIAIFVTGGISGAHLNPAGSPAHI